jgi:hypothetical protein
MNKLNLFTGGFLLRNDDFDFLQNANNIALLGYAKAFAGQNNNGNVILSGCELTLVAANNNGFDEYDISAGFVLYNFEPLPCPAQQSVLVAVGSDYQLQIEELFLATGTRLYANNVPHESHVFRQVILAEYDGNGVSYDQFLKFNDALARILNTYENIHTQDNFLNSWLSTSGNYEIIQKGGGKQLVTELVASAAFINASKGYTEVITNIYQPLRPIRDIEMVCRFTNIGAPNQLADDFVAIRIKQNGDVVAVKTNNDTNNSVIKINAFYF